MNDISKLPKWAQDHIADLRRQRDTALNKLNDFVDDQTPSHFYVDDHVCVGEKSGPTTKRHYIQTEKMTVEYGKITLNIYCRDDQRGEHPCIDLQWGYGYSNQEVAMIPESFQKVRLVAHEHMRE